ncbi:MAG: methyltransferase domain-containing protein [Bacteroidota bacterium]
MKNSAESMHAFDNRSYIGSAAGRKRVHILSKILVRSSLSFFDRVHFDKNANGLDIFCGDGTSTRNLSETLGPHNTIHGFDHDATNIRFAQEKIAQHIPRLRFKLLKNDNWYAAKTYAFIYCRTFLNQSYPPAELFQKMYASLQDNGTILLEYFDPSNFHCYPQNYAFERYLELYTSLKNIQKTRIESVGTLRTLLSQNRFQRIQIQQIAPAFLPEDCKQISSLCLESIGPQLQEHQLITPTELQALLSELKSFEKQKNTMICLPGIYQVVGYK